MSGSLAVPPGFADAVCRWNGVAGRRWLDDLPALVARATERWSLTVGEPYPGGMCPLLRRVWQGGRPVGSHVSWVDDDPDQGALPLTRRPAPPSDRLDAVTDHAGRWAGLADWVQGGRTCSPPSDAGPLVGSGADGAHGAGSPRW